MGMFVIFLIDTHRLVRFGLPQVKQRPLTTNSPENAVGSGAISPDGKKLVYSDGKGLHVRLMYNGETRSVPVPDTLKAKTFTAVDAIKGRGPELIHFALDPNEGQWFVDMAPDGEQIAALKHSECPIYLLSLRSNLTSEIRLKHWTNLRSVRWAADGKGLFVGTGFGPGTLLYVDLAGNPSRLWEHASPLLSIASPDGRHLAIADHTMDRNLWMVEDF